MFTHPGVTWVSWRLTSPCGYVGMMESHVLQITWILWKPIATPGNLGVMEICSLDPRRAHTLLFLRPPPQCSQDVATTLARGLCPASPLLAQHGVEEKRSFPIFPANWGRGGQPGMGPGRGAPHTWRAGIALASCSSTATMQVARRNLGDQRENVRW